MFVIIAEMPPSDLSEEEEDEADKASGHQSDDDEVIQEKLPIQQRRRWGRSIPESSKLRPKHRRL